MIMVMAGINEWLFSGNILRGDIPLLFEWLVNDWLTAIMNGNIMEHPAPDEW